MKKKILTILIFVFCMAVCGMMTACGLGDSSQSAEHEHDYAFTVTAPTCTEEGYTTYRCKTCSDEYVGEKTAALGHDYASAVTEPTCTEEGYTEYKCKRCSAEYVGDIVDALGHDYTHTHTEATCTTDGQDEYLCNRCQYSYTENFVKAKGHTYLLGVCANCEEDYPLAQGLKMAEYKTYAMVLSYKGTASEVEVPAYYHRVPVTEIADNAFAGAKLNSLTLPCTLERIADGAFDNASIRKVSFGGSYVSWKYLVQDTTLVALSNVEYLDSAQYGYLQMPKSWQSFYFDLYSNCMDYLYGKTYAQSMESDGVTLYYIAEMNLQKYGISTAEAISVHQTFNVENPQFFWMRNYTFLFGAASLYWQPCDVLCNTYEKMISYKEAIREMYAAVAEVLLECDTDYARGKAIFDYIRRHTSYIDDTAAETNSGCGQAHSMLGFVNGHGVVCEGYAKTFQYLCTGNGIRALSVVGLADQNGSSWGFHAWNMIYLEDNRWHCVDVTWGESRRYYCRGKTNFYTTHKPGSSSATGQGYWYDLPEPIDTEMYTG